MPLIKNAVLLPIKAGKLLNTLRKSKSVQAGAIGVSGQIAGSVAKGSAITLEGGGTVSATFGEEQLQVNAELNEAVLFTQTGLATMVYFGSQYYFVEKFQMKRRWAMLAKTMTFIADELAGSLKTFREIEELAVTQNEGIQKMLRAGDTAEDIFEQAGKNTQKLEQLLAFSAGDINNAEGGLLRLKYINDPAVKLSQLDDNWPLRIGDPTNKNFKSAAKLLEPAVITQRRELGQEIGIFKYLFNQPENFSDEIWPLESTITNWKAQINELKQGLTANRNELKATREGIVQMKKTLVVSGIRTADISMINTIDNFAIQSTEAVTDTIKRSTSLGDDLAKQVKLAATKADDVIKTGAKIGGSVVGRFVSAALLVDGIYWAATATVDVVWNFFGTAEKDQKIPFLSDIPYIGRLFDFGTDKLGASVVDDFIITPVLNWIFKGFLPDEVEANLVDAAWIIILGASQNDTLADFVENVLEFYVDEINADFEVPTGWGGEQDATLPLMNLIPQEPLIILQVMAYAIIAKIVFRAWVVPSAAYFMRQVGSSPSA